MRALIFVSLAMFAQGAYGFDHTHDKWAQFLKRYVVQGSHASQVKYKEALKDRKLLDEYVTQITHVSRSEYDKWTPAEKQAFLINSYNALTVKLILDKDIPPSIKKIGSLWRSTWKIKFFKFLGEESHLDRVEHELARGVFNNCRFHFAFNCASVGCPMLKGEPWLGSKLDAQFEEAARAFLQDKTRNRYNPSTQSLELSKIFDWYGEDFVKDKTCGGSVQTFVGKYMQTPKGHRISSDTPIKFLDYDWNLNLAR